MHSKLNQESREARDRQTTAVARAAWPRENGCRPAPPMETSAALVGRQGRSVMHCLSDEDKSVAHWSPADCASRTTCPRLATSKTPPQAGSCPTPPGRAGGYLSREYSRLCYGHRIRHRRPERATTQFTGDNENRSHRGRKHRPDTQGDAGQRRRCDGDKPWRQCSARRPPCRRRHGRKPRNLRARARCDRQRTAVLSQ